MSTYTLLISHTPAQGKAPALRAALEEHTKASNVAGGRYSLRQRLYGSEPAFINLMQFDGLAALDAYRAAAPGDAARIARINKINECLARPQSTILSEVLVPGTSATPAAYVQRVRLFPALGKAGELRKLLEERVKLPRKGAITSSLHMEVAPEQGTNFTILNGFANLAGLEEARAANQGDPTWAAFQAKLAGLLAEQPRQELHAVLVPIGAK